MNHHMNVIIETEVLGKKGTKKKIQSVMTVEDILVEKYQNGGMKLATYKIPFKSFVKNFGTTLSYIMGSATTTGVNTANGASQAASTFMSVSEAAINNTTNSIHSRRGIYVGDNLENDTIAAASTALVSASTSKSFLTGAVGRNTSKNDTFIGRRIEASSASVATKVSYGAMSITIPTDDKVKLTRRFYNSRGSAITIGEIGLGTQNVISAGYFVDHNILLARDITSRPFDLEDQQYLDITMEISVPSTGYLTTNFIVMLANIFKNSSTGYNYKIVSGIVPVNPPLLTGLSVKGIADNTDYGIQIGSRYDSFSIYDYKLINMYSNAVLDRSATTFINNLNTYNTTTRFGFQRDFTNVGSTRVEIAEGSLQVKDQDDKGIVISRFPTGDILLDPNDILRVKFYFDFPVSAGGLTEV